MVFASLPFLLLFLPLVLLGSFLLPRGVRLPFLLLMNLICYAYGEPVYVLLMAASILVNYLWGRRLERAGTQGRKKIWLVTGLAANLLALGWFKYAMLFWDSLRAIPALSALPALKVVLPIGISFYTFQAMSYLIDVYRGDSRAERSLLGFATYISLFPQLIAGPIVRYADVADALHHNTRTLAQVSWGVRLFVIGLAKKVLLANELSLLWQEAGADPAAMGTLGAWMGIFAFTMQLYFDFSGYSDMARGLGAMLGFSFPENFRYPFCAESVTEYWRRWHITLGQWFRDYVYIPMGGNKRGPARQYLNIFVVWGLTGFWHGANWTFLLWGLYYGVLLTLEKRFYYRRLQKIPRAFGALYSFVAAMLGFVLFASDGLGQALGYYAALFSPAAGRIPAGWLCAWLPLGTLAIVGSTPAPARLWGAVRGKPWAVWTEGLLCLAAMVLAAASLVSGGYNPFLYFRF